MGKSFIVWPNLTEIEKCELDDNYHELVSSPGQHLTIQGHNVGSIVWLNSDLMRR